MAQLGPSMTGLSHLVYLTKDKKRKDFEAMSDVHKQCRATIGEPNQSTKCWLCGFTIKNLQAEAASVGFRVNIDTEMLEDYTCEHVLPIKLAFTVATLHQLQGLKYPPQNYEALMRTEYEYAHNLCNYAKTNHYFLSWQNYQPGRDLCSLAINDNKILEFLNNLYDYKQVGSTRKSVIKFTYPQNTWASAPQSFEHEITNLVQANLIIQTKIHGGDWNNPQHREQIKSKWISQQAAAIRLKMTSTMNYIMQADKCGTSEAGAWSRQITDRIGGSKLASTLEPAPQFQAGQSDYMANQQGVTNLLQFAYGGQPVSHFGTPIGQPGFFRGGVKTRRRKAHNRRNKRKNRKSIRK